MLKVNLMPTDVCHRHCGFCGMRSTGRGEVLPLQTAAEVVRQIAGFKDREKLVCVSGGGEPLEYPHLPELFGLLLATNITRLALMTSGCKDQAERGFSNLVALSQIQDERLQPTLSVNYLHSQVTIQRLLTTVPYLEQMSTWMDLRYVCTMTREPERMKRGLNRIGQALLKLGYCFGVEDLSQAETSKLDEDMLASLNEAWLDSSTLYKNPVVDVSPEKVVLSSDHHIAFEVQPVEFTGRAADLFDPPFRAQGSEHRTPCEFLKDPAQRALDIRPSGEIFPCCCEGWDSRMRLGNIADMTLRQALAAKADKLRWAKANYQANPFDDNSWLQCHRCWTE